MSAFARLEAVEPRNRRAGARRKLNLGARLATTGDEVVIHDLSSTGILIETQADLETSDELEVELPEIGPAPATIVWNSGHYFGCQFARPIPRSALSAAVLRNPTAQPAAAPVQPISIVDDDETETPGNEDDRFSFAVRLRVILGLTVMLWALILWAAGVL